jgi:hypothetical protein
VTNSTYLTYELIEAVIHNPVNIGFFVWGDGFRKKFRPKALKIGVAVARRIIDKLNTISVVGPKNWVCQGWPKFQAYM